jgi:putative hydrolase of the HAD superfamily
MPITTIAFDGDDTLWHHENFMEEAQDDFHNLMNSIGSYPDARKHLEDKHIADLTLWGYGVRSLVLSMIEVSINMTGGMITGDKMKEIMEIGKKLYMHPITLLEHVAETIIHLHNRYQLVLITKGDLIAQEMKISKSGLSKYFDGIEIVTEKNVETYQKILGRYKINPAEMIMVGNSIRSDILPALKIGAQAIHIPYHTSWQFEVAEVAETDKNKFVVLPSMKSVPELLERLEKSGEKKLSDICQESCDLRF